MSVGDYNENGYYGSFTSGYANTSTINWGNSSIYPGSFQRFYIQDGFGNYREVDAEEFNRLRQLEFDNCNFKIKYNLIAPKRLRTRAEIKKRLMEK